jgi:hypothetical protein
MSLVELHHENLDFIGEIRVVNWRLRWGSVLNPARNACIFPKPVEINEVSPEVLDVMRRWRRAVS